MNGYFISILLAFSIDENKDTTAMVTQVSVRWMEAKCQTGEIRALQDKTGAWLVLESELRENLLLYNG